MKNLNHKSRFAQNLKIADTLIISHRNRVFQYVTDLATTRSLLVLQIWNGDQNPSDQSEHHLEEGY